MGEVAEGMGNSHERVDARWGVTLTTPGYPDDRRERPTYYTCLLASCRSTSVQHCPSALARYLGAARYGTVAGGGTLGLTGARVVPVYRCPN